MDDACLALECHRYAHCVSLTGSAECQCNLEYEGDGIDSCTRICLPGYRPVNGICENINECLNDDENRCHHHATCVDTIGSYTCQCNKGHKGDGIWCLPIGECSQAGSYCASNADCVERTSDKWACTCFDGYEGDGYSCQDIDECATHAHTCDLSVGLCINSEPYYKCSCEMGYELIGFDKASFHGEVSVHVRVQQFTMVFSLMWTTYKN